MHATEALGLNSYWQRTSVREVMMMGHEAEVARLPANPYTTDTQNQTTGVTYFVAGASRAGGGDPVA